MTAEARFESLSFSMDSKVDQTTWFSVVKDGENNFNCVLDEKSHSSLEATYEKGDESKSTDDEVLRRVGELSKERTLDNILDPLLFRALR